MTQRRLKNRNKARALEPSTSVQDELELEDAEKMLLVDNDHREEFDKNGHDSNLHGKSEIIKQNMNEKVISVEKNHLEVDKSVQGEESCTLDLRNLLTINSHQVNHQNLYRCKDGNSNDSVSIHVTGTKDVNEDQLLRKANNGCSQLLKGLWELETEKTDAGSLAILPAYFEQKTPRELPPPAPKVTTKWEKFAKDRGIVSKEKQSRKVWDEATQSWAHLTGYQKSSDANDPESWPIVEVKRNEDPYEDPWQRARDAKKERVEKNVITRMRNEERAGNLNKGTTTRTMKAKKATRDNGREAGKKDLSISTPVLLEDNSPGQQLGKVLTKKTLVAAQTSTASLGKFDQMRDGEPERKKATLSGLKKRKFQQESIRKAAIGEVKKNMKLLENVIAGGNAKEKSIRRGDAAKGETAYDFDYNDGLRPSTYKKNKGKAGIGKMKKVTKKMAK